MYEQVEHFLGFLKNDKGYSDNTIAAYRNDLSQFVSFIDNHLPDATKSWHQVDAAIVQQYGDHLDQQIVARKYAASTVARKVASVKSFFSYLTSARILPDNPAPILRAPKVEKLMPQILTLEETERLLAEPVKGNTPKALRDRAMLELLYATGMRVSEMIRLPMSDLDLPNSRIVLHSRDDRTRSLPLPPQALEALSGYLKKGRDALLRGREENIVFVNQRGKPLTRQGLWLIIKSYASGAGINPGFTPHTLRHSCAAHRLAQGADLQQVRKLLGHANISTTQIYQEMVEQTQAP